ncbi:hypothetical protein JOE54_003687 [Brachybacterium tyrofermentans]
MMRFFAGQTPLIIYEFVYLPPPARRSSGEEGRTITGKVGASLGYKVPNAFVNLVTLGPAL